MMTVRKASALTLALAGAVGLGIWIGPYVTHRGSIANEPAAPPTQASAPATHPDQAAHAERKRALAPGRASTKRPTAPAETPVKIAASAPELQQRLKPVLNKGADMAVASREFRDGQEFAAVAHAARNTEVPFMVLKHRVVDEHKRLADAIHEFKPELDATGEAERATAQARADIAAIKG